MRIHSERGMAIPIVIFIVTLLTITLAAAFARVGAEREMAVGASDAVNALTVAQSGLQNYLGGTVSRPPNGDSVRYNVTGGYADVVARIVQHPADTLQRELFIVRSTGYVIVPALGAATQGKRTIAQFAHWQVGAMRHVAAFTAANGVREKSPESGISISGNDTCGVMPQIRSVRGASNSGSLTQGSYTPAPLISGAGNFVADTTGVDWVTILNGGFVPDYYTVHTGDFTYSASKVTGNATINASGSDVSGSGLLMVTGDLTTSGTKDVYWYGVVLVGGEIIFNAKHTHFQGLVISGLNELVGNPNRGDLGGQGGSKVYHITYASCYVQPSLARFVGFVPVRNGWVDNWATY